MVNWRQACDERGLSQLQWCRYNNQLLQYLLDGLMPWDQQELWSEVDRYVCICRGNLSLVLMVLLRSLDGVWSLTHESLTTNIKSREWRRKELENAGVHREHPRTSTTDDLRCFFSVMSDMVGKHFTVREAQHGWSREFGKLWTLNCLFTITHCLMIGFMKVLLQIMTQPNLPISRNRILGSKGSAIENSQAI